MGHWKERGTMSQQGQVSVKGKVKEEHYRERKLCDYNDRINDCAFVEKSKMQDASFVIFS